VYIYLNLKCPACLNEALIVRICSCDEKHAVIVCDDCSTMYLDPDHLDKVYDVDSVTNTTNCPYGEGILLTWQSRYDPGPVNDSHWADEKEIENAGWKHHIWRS
jgi:hypothetical protein